MRTLHIDSSILNHLDGQRMPLKVNVVTNYTCNLACAYCDVKSLDKRMMSTAQTIQMIDELADWGMQQIHFIGGEPLLRKDLGELLAQCKRHGITTAVHSNGLLVPEMDNQLLDCIDVFHTCINGPKAIHELSRGSETFEPIIEAVKVMRAMGASVVSDMVITQTNCDQASIDYVLDLAGEMGFRVNFQPVFEHALVNANNGMLDALRMTDRQLFSAFRYILDRSDEKCVFNSKEYLTDIVTRGFSEFKRCYRGILSFVIDPLGNISRCYKYVQQHQDINGVHLGWREAIKRVHLTDCRQCLYSAHIEDNYIFQSSRLLSAIPMPKASGSCPDAEL